MGTRNHKMSTVLLYHPVVQPSVPESDIIVTSGGLVGLHMEYLLIFPFPDGTLLIFLFPVGIELVLLCLCVELTFLNSHRITWINFPFLGTILSDFVWNKVN